MRAKIPYPTRTRQHIITRRESHIGLSANASDNSLSHQTTLLTHNGSHIGLNADASENLLSHQNQCTVTRTAQRQNPTFFNMYVFQMNPKVELWRVVENAVCGTCIVPSGKFNSLWKSHIGLSANASDNPLSHQTTLLTHDESHIGLNADASENPLSHHNQYTVPRTAQRQNPTFFNMYVFQMNPYVELWRVVENAVCGTCIVPSGKFNSLWKYNMWK